MGEFKQISREALRTEGFPKPPIDLTEEVMLSLSEEQRQILFDLADLCEKQGELIEKSTLSNQIWLRLIFMTKLV